jgi:hypothetical protein
VITLDEAIDALWPIDYNKRWTELSFAYGELKAERDELRKRLKEAREVLRELEWDDTLEGMFGSGLYCQVCNSYQHKGHTKACRLAAVLRESYTKRHSVTDPVTEEGTAKD